MIAYLNRLDRTQKLGDQAVEHKGDLYLDACGTFTFYFERTAKQMLLNDNNYYDLRVLSGEIRELSVDKMGMHIAAFVNADGQWFKDKFLFYFRPNRC